MKLREVFEWWIALQEPPSRYACTVLAEWTDSELHKEKLQHFASPTPDGKSEYFAYCQREKRNFLEVMKEFQINPDKVNFAHLIQIVGKQRPREYSIASFTPGHYVALTVALTEYETKFKRQITGVCSRFFKNAEVGTTVPCWLKKGTMRFP
jgi:sulfite reductase alpha subunit-like flavoprotein